MTHHQIVIIGGGTAGISVAARLRNKKLTDIAVIEPATTHYYQPLWTLVGGGLAPAEDSKRPMSDVIPRGVTWIPHAAADIDPHANTVTLVDGSTITYDALIVAVGLQLDWDAVPGMRECITSARASSNYGYELAPRTWELIQSMRSGTAVFTMPSGPIKCAGAPQKIAYLAADYWRRQGVLENIRMVLVLPTPGMFGVQVFSDELVKVAARYGIEVRLASEVTQIDSVNQQVTISSMDDASQTEQLSYDMLHVVPRQSAPDWLKKTELAVPDTPTGYVDVDKHTMQHVRFENVFALGDCGSTPNSKTGAAIRAQAPVVVNNVLAYLDQQPLPASYDGYASCPLTTARDKILIAEFDYTMQPHPTLPVVNTLKEVRDFGQFKRRVLPNLYWHFMLRGLA